MKSIRAITTSVGAVLCLLVVAAYAAHHEAPPPVEVTELLSADVNELAGKRASVVRVTFQPGAASPPHRHPGTVLVYVLEGEIQSALNDEKAVLYRAGESWSEPVGALHRVAVNATDKPTVLLAVLIHGAEDALQRPAEE